MLKVVSLSSLNAKVSHQEQVSGQTRKIFITLSSYMHMFFLLKLNSHISAFSCVLRVKLTLL